MTDLLATVTAIRATNARDADLQIARAVLDAMTIPNRPAPLLESMERTAQRIAPRMAAIAGPQAASELARIETELLDESRIVLDAFATVIRELRAEHAQAA